VLFSLDYAEHHSEPMIPPSPTPPPTLSRCFYSNQRNIWGHVRSVFLPTCPRLRAGGHEPSPSPARNGFHPHSPSRARRQVPPSTAFFRPTRVCTGPPPTRDPAHHMRGGWPSAFARRPHLSNVVGGSRLQRVWDPRAGWPQAQVVLCSPSNGKGEVGGPHLRYSSTVQRPEQAGSSSSYRVTRPVRGSCWAR